MWRWGVALTIPFAVYRWLVIALTALAVLAPLSILAYQSLLSGPLVPLSAEFDAGAYKIVLADPRFWTALLSTLALAVGMTAIAVPLGAGLAFLVVRTDLPGRGWLEPLLLVPIVVSTLVLAFGYVLMLGPSGLLTGAVRNLIGGVPWNVHSLPALIVLAGLIHVSHVYLCTAAALRGLGGDIEDSARIVGAGPWEIAVRMSLPLVRPAIGFAGLLVFFLGFEMFGLPWVLGDARGISVLSTYLYKLGSISDGRSHQIMAVVAVLIVAAAIPLVLLQRVALGRGRRSGPARGEGPRSAPLRLRAWRWPAFFATVLWLAITVLLPLAGIALRSLTGTAGQALAWPETLVLDHYRALFAHPNVVHGMINTLLLGVVGAGLAVGCYAAVALALHRRPRRWRAIDYVAMLPRAMPGLVAGFAMLLLFASLPALAPLKDTLVPVWLAYAIVWLGFGMRLVSGPLTRIAPELEEAARVVGANATRVRHDVTVPLIRASLLAGWVIVFLVFARDYSTGIFLLGPGPELIGPLLVSLWGGGSIDLVSALSVVNVAMAGVGLAIVWRVGARFDG